MEPYHSSPQNEAFTLNLPCECCITYLSTATRFYFARMYAR